ncbi:glutathione S-transferase family protein [Limnohabitans sp.]|uniref:glutathione S-transferase family protein n=1 Tax=Limnohabitans sp. TaxID=1907725 RepID=UPI0038BD0430
MALTLIIGNKNYSSWSMRPWVLMTQAGIAFTEQRVRFDSFEPDSAFKHTLQAVSPVGKVPVLVDDQLTGGQPIWDTLAICEYLAETYPALHLWPENRIARAHARSLCAEMHAGFGHLRSLCPMNIEAHLPDVGARLMHEHVGLQQDLQRITDMWQDLLQSDGGPLLFGEFSIADAYFAPVCMRIRTYALPVPAEVQAYIARVVALPGVAAWMQQALAEHDFRAFEEPYRQA